MSRSRRTFAFKSMDADDIEYHNRVKDIPRHRRERCVTTGKIVWKSQSKAASIAKGDRLRTQDPLIVPYACAHCSGWHVGHARGTERIREDLKIMAKKG